MPGVTTEHEVYRALKEKWSRCRDCVAGSDAVKSRGVKYLPALDSHKRAPEKYSEYVLRALFYNAMGRTVVGLAGSIFQKAPTIEVEGPTEEHIKDITLTDEPLDMFALEVTKEYLVTGRYGILVDMSTEEAVEPRPYWVGYPAEDIINWRFKKMGGDQELNFVVLREWMDQIEPKDEFTSKLTVQYRVLRLSDDGIYTQQVYRPTSDQTDYSGDKFAAGPVMTPERKGNPLNFIPFVLPWAVNTPPLIDLVDVNLSHYRGSADLKHGLHYTALPTPWVSGYSGEPGKPLQIGSGTAWSLDKDGKAGMLEFTGAGLEAIRLDLQEMQRMMATLGARLLQDPPRYAETALSVSMRHASDYATLRTIAQIVEQQITWALKIHAWWLNTDELVAERPENVELNKTFHDQSLTADELRALLLALQSNSISYKTFYARLYNTGWMREGVDDEQELRDIEEQPEMIGVAPALTESAKVAGGGAPNPKQPAGTDERLQKDKVRSKVRSITKKEKEEEDD